jgi:glycosyltransferase involved in cell wall biosynthesis
MDVLQNAKGYYVSFVKEEDKIIEDYIETILEKTGFEFDCYFLNYDITYDYKNPMKINSNEGILGQYKPYYGEYIWAFVYKREKLLNLLSTSNEEEWNRYIDDNFHETYALGQVLYFHNPNGKKFIEEGPLLDIKKEERFKNLIYMGDGCNGAFNGYISWLNNIGRCFKDKYDICILYDNMPDKTYEMLSEQFKVIHYKRDINYVCDVFISTYTSFYYPKNIFILESSNLFIHGNVRAYDYVETFSDDIYTNYIAVSKLAAEKAVGCFPRDDIKSIMNPFKMDKKLLKPHLRLTSAFRYTEEKRPDRIELVGRLLDELDIPYTWNVFTDRKENTNESNGLIFRNRTYNPLPYINDCDYFVLLSDTEAMPYCIIEALACNTKVVVTPLEAYNELGIKDGENGIIIPFEYFEEENIEKLKGILQKMYKEKDKKINYKLDESKWEGYNDVFKE